MKTLRILVGILLVGGVLEAARRAVGDCAVAPYTYDNCLWLFVRERLSLPQNRLLRAGVLELVGLALAFVLYIALRYVFPWPQRRSPGKRIEQRSRRVT